MYKKMIGVISDTHGLLRPEAVTALQNSDMIIHAGDIGTTGVLRGLEAIAPVTAVRGNIDQMGWAKILPLTQALEIGSNNIYILHNIDQLVIDPEAAGFQIVIYGHSHVPKIENKKGILYLNPGSAGPKRFKLPITVAKLFIDGQSIETEIIELVVPRSW